MLNQGVEQKSSNNINITISGTASNDSVFGAAEMMVSLLSASRFTEENKEKTENELFIEATRSLFSILGELRKNNTNLWWDLYVTTFYDLVQTSNYEAFCYYILQSSNSDEVNIWISKNQDKMQSLKEWMNIVRTSMLSQ